jgi:prepilin-type N-terminal cleavage/methylation domain-containing protein
MKREKNSPRQKNSGFSLVELIVVMAIMVVLAGSSIYAMNMLNGRQAKQCRDELLSKLDGVRATTMGKRSTKAVLEGTGNGYVLKVKSSLNGTDYDEKSYKLASDKVTLYYATDASSDTGTVLDKTSGSLTIEFDRASGAMKQQADGSYIYQFIAEQNGKKYGIRIYPETGKIQAKEFD